MWETNLAAPIRAVHGLLNADPHTLYTDEGEAGQQAAADSFDVAGSVTAGSAFTPKPTNSLAMGVKAYHGSPHHFDRFDMSKIGTGEGAQVYGHGLYFAENEGVAKGYRDRITGWRSTGDDPGAMYEVDINAEPHQFIDYDRPLGEQPDVTAKMGGWDTNVSFWKRNKIGPDPRTLTGGQWLARYTKDPAKMSAALKERGIPGVKYLDAGSRVPSAMAKKELDGWKEQLAYAETELAKARANGERHRTSYYEGEVKRVQDGIARVQKEADGTRNYVVFDDQLVSILKKYGIAGLLGSSAAMGAANQSEGEY